MATPIVSQGSPTATQQRRAQVIPLRLVAKAPAMSPLQADTIKCLRHLLDLAEQGEITGITYAAMSENREFSIGSCGEAYRNPGFASQVISAMWYHTMRRIFGDAE